MKSWMELVDDAIDNPDEGLAQLFKMIDVYLFPIAHKIAKQLVEDSIQAAHIKIWRMLPKVKRSEPNTVKSVLIVTAVFAMRDEVRKFLRSNRGVIKQSDELLGLIESPQPSDESFSGLLADYYDFVCTHGTFLGSHKYIAKKRKKSIARIKTEYYREIKLVFGRDVGDGDSNKAIDDLFEKYG